MKNIGLNISSEGGSGGLANDEVVYLFETANIFMQTLQRENNTLYALFMNSYLQRKDIIFCPLTDLEILLDLKTILAKVVPQMLKEFEIKDLAENKLHFIIHTQKIYCLNKEIVNYMPPAGVFVPYERAIYLTFSTLNSLYQNITYCIENNETLRFCWDK